MSGVAEFAESSAGAGDDQSLRLQILGPLRVWRGQAELDLGPRQQMCLLAVLVARAEQPVSTGELIDLIWGERSPDSALNVIHKYVGALRRVFEPSVPARSSGTYLARRGSGYMFIPGKAFLDSAQFQVLVDTAKRAFGEDQPEVALGHYERALTLWKGPAGDGLDYASSAASVFVEINTRFFDVCVAAAELAVSLRSPQRVVAPLRLAAAMAPLNEPVHAALVSLLAAGGQQAEALELFRVMRQRLADDLGIDPGQALQRAHQRVLSRQLARRDIADEYAAHPAPPAFDIERPPRPFVGRVGELAALAESVDAAIRGGTGLALVEGEPGIGKTRLVEEAAATTGHRGALIAWGSTPASAGTPAMWPWIQAIRAVLTTIPEDTQQHWWGGDISQFLDPTADLPARLPDSGARFRLFERVTAMIGVSAASRPIVLVIDDLHWADLPSLELFAHLASRLPPGVALIGALRDKAPTPGADLTRVLAAASRVPGVHRVHLRPLAPSHVAMLIHAETGREPSGDMASRVHQRTAGNPFFVREVSRLLAQREVFTDQDRAFDEVPATVRDIVLDRLAGVDNDVKQLVFTAALVGRDSDVRVLAHAVGIAVEACLDHLAALDELGLFTSTADPFGIRFVHDLVRDAVVEMVPSHRARRMHARIADALQTWPTEGESVEERLAHHLWAAGPCVQPDRTADALTRAARRMVNKCAFEAAEQNLRTAMRVSRQAAMPELELAALTQLIALKGMQSMYGASGLRDLLQRAEQIATSLERQRVAAGFLFSRWASHHQAVEFEMSRPLARQLYERGCASEDPVVRAYGFQAWGLQQWNTGNIGDAFRSFERCKQSLLQTLRETDGDDPVSRDLQWLMVGVLAETTALHGDIVAAREIFDVMESIAGTEPYLITVWTTLACRTASLVGDARWALQVAQRGVEADPGFDFVVLGTYLRLARSWAVAMAGDQPAAAAAAAAEELIVSNLLDPPRSGAANWYTLVAEMWIKAGDCDRAASALDSAEQCMQDHGQRYSEALLLLMRARLLRAQGAPAGQVAGEAERARSVSTDRGAHLFAQRADAFLAELGSVATERAV
ncbi:BTAD domain-containing putative transcriptional regulator [Mycobacterium sp. C31M]